MRIKKKMNNAQNVWCIVSHDIARGFYSNRFRYFIAVLILVCVIAIMGNTEFGFLDTIFFMQAGYDVVMLIKDGKIVFPFVWILIQFLVPFLIYNYCNDDCEGVGVDFLIKCRNKRLWWCSKCLWNILTVFSFYALEYLIAFLYSLHNGKEQMVVHYEIFEKISNKPLPDNENNIWIIVYLFIMPVIVSIVLSLFQMTISMLFNPMIGMIAVMAWNVLSVFVYHPLMIGNAAMVIRSSVYNASRINVWTSVLICIIFYIVVYVFGVLSFEKKDILMKEG